MWAMVVQKKLTWKASANLRKALLAAGCLRDTEIVHTETDALRWSSSAEK